MLAKAREISLNGSQLLEISISVCAVQVKCGIKGQYPNSKMSLCTKFWASRIYFSS